MKRISWTLFFSLIIAAPLLADDSTAPANASMPATAESTTNTSPFNSERQRASYALGMMIGHNWQQSGVDVDFDVFAQGFKDAQSGGTMLMTPQEMQETLKEYQKTIAERQQKLREQIAAENKMKGEEFLAANQKKEDVKVLKDGLQYKVINQGKGPRPGSNDVVMVNYRGTLLDGTEFDSTAPRGQPSEFPLNQIIPGWREALQLMKAGSVWELYIPSDLAYGAVGHAPQIPANATLIFTVQLISSAPPGKPLPSTSAVPLTSDIIAVPSAAELKKGKQPYTLKPEEVEKIQKQYEQTNRPAN